MNRALKRTGGRVHAALFLGGAGGAEPPVRYGRTSRNGYLQSIDGAPEGVREPKEGTQVRVTLKISGVRRILRAHVPLREERKASPTSCAAGAATSIRSSENARARATLKRPFGGSIDVPQPPLLPEKPLG